MVMGNSLWQLVWQSDRMTQLVLLFLLGLSIVSWTVFMYKLIMFRIKRRHMQEALHRVRDVQTMDGLLSIAAAFAGTLPGYMLSKNLSFFKKLMQRESNAETRQEQWDYMQQHMHQTVDMVIAHEESYLPVLSTTAAISPLLGLFGTVWGLVHAFIRISERQTADITTVAPGIAEALVTTLAGLMVAIPALVLVNYLYAQVREMEKISLRFSDAFGMTLRMILMTQG